MVIYNSDLYITKFASGSGNTAPFCGVTFPNTKVTNFVESGAIESKQAGLTSVNIGYSRSNGSSIDYYKNLPIGMLYGLRVGPRSEVSQVFVRASTHTTAGIAKMYVKREVQVN